MPEVKLEGLDAIAARLRELQARAPDVFNAALKAECDRMRADMALDFARASLWYHLTAPPEDDD